MTAPGLESEVDGKRGATPSPTFRFSTQWKTSRREGSSVDLSPLCNQAKLLTVDVQFPPSGQVLKKKQVL